MEITEMGDFQKRRFLLFDTYFQEGGFLLINIFKKGDFC